MHKISSRGTLILLAFPSIFLTSQLLMKYYYRYFYISDFDPVYAFLFNGLSFARGIPGSGLARFPGTTVQLFLAGIIHIAHLFRANKSITEDVLMHPEFYLNLASICLALMSTIILILTGFLLYKRTGRYDIAIFLQFTSFFSVFGFYYSTLIMCEPFLLLAVQLIILQLALYYFSGNNTMTNRQLLITAITAGFGLSTKISFLPVIFLPMLVVKGISVRLKYLLYTIIAAAVFALPVYPDVSDLTEWIKIIFMHTGLYGTGEAKIIDFKLYFENLRTIIFENPFFTVFIFGMVLYFLFRLNKNCRKKIPEKDQRFLAGFTMVIFLLTMELSKHYRPYYTGFYYGLCVFPLAIFINTFKYFSFRSFQLQIGNRLLTILVFVFGLILVFRLYAELITSVKMRNLYSKSIYNIQSIVGNRQRIIVTHYGSSAFKELALYFGKSYSNGQKDFYSAELNRLYQDTYFYSDQGDRLYNWNSEFSLPDILSDDTVIYVVTRQGTDMIPESLDKEINYFKNHGLVRKYLTVYKNEITHDYVMKVTGDRVKIHNYFSDGVSISCSCEFLTNDAQKFISSDRKYLFDKAFMRTDENKFSGKYSVKANENNPYAMDVNIPVVKNSYIKATVWRHTPDGKGLIVAHNKIYDLYKAGSSIKKHENGWDFINLNVSVPDNFRDDTIHFYLWYNGKDSCYFDDFKISEYPGY